MTETRAVRPSMRPTELEEPEIPDFLDKRPKDRVATSPVRSEGSLPEDPTEQMTHAEAQDADAEFAIGCARRIREMTATLSTSVVCIGNELIRAKQKLGHGKFAKWAEAELGFSLKTAQRFMSAVRWADGKNDIVSHLEPTTIYHLAKRGTPSDVYPEIRRRIGAGQPVTTLLVKELTREATCDRAEQTTKRNSAHLICPTDVSEIAAMLVLRLEAREIIDQQCELLHGVRATICGTLAAPRGGSRCAATQADRSGGGRCWHLQYCH